MLLLETAQDVARAAFPALLIDENAKQPRLLGQMMLRGEARVTGPAVDHAARAMTAALAMAFQALETQLPGLSATRR